MLVPTNESSKKIKRSGEMQIKIRDLIRLITKNLDDQDEKYTKMKFDSDDELPKKKKNGRNSYHDNSCQGSFS